MNSVTTAAAMDRTMGNRGCGEGEFTNRPVAELARVPVGPEFLRIRLLVGTAFALANHPPGRAAWPAAARNQACSRGIRTAKAAETRLMVAVAMTGES